MSGFIDFSLDDSIEGTPSKKHLPLLIELVPQTSWGDNLRSRLQKKDWDRLRKGQARWAGWHCEICGQSGKDQGYKWPVECHEVWSYDDENHIQKLDRLISLCPLCHKVKHYGRTFNVEGHEGALAALKRMMWVNGWKMKDAQAHVSEAFSIWEKRSHHVWTLDLSFLKEAGVSLFPA